MSKRPGFILTVGVMSLLSSCNNEEDKSSDQTGHFTQASFDGAWAWYEDGARVYDVVIENGAISSLQSAGANAKKRKYSSTHCAVSPIDGLVAFSYAIPNPNSSWVELTMFRFDLSDLEESCVEVLETGILPGQRIVEDSDPDDIFMFPPKEIKSGELRRTDTR